ncbi:MAG: DUF3291 domain-containing protein [Acidimicrobiales bacterium]
MLLSSRSSSRGWSTAVIGVLCGCGETKRFQTIRRKSYGVKAPVGYRHPGTQLESKSGRAIPRLGPCPRSIWPSSTSPAKGPTDGPIMAEFMANLERINTLAEASPGFVWRFQTDDGDATSVRAFDDPDLLLNLSTWESIETFKQYVYKSAHAEFLPRRREWFEPVPELPVLVMWWIPAGTEPSIDEEWPSSTTSLPTARHRSVHVPHQLSRPDASS